MLSELGFDAGQHDKIKMDLKSGRIGLSKNRLPISTTITDIHESEIAQSNVMRHAEFISESPDYSCHTAIPRLKRGMTAIIRGFRIKFTMTVLTMTV